MRLVLLVVAVVAVTAPGAMPGEARRSEPWPHSECSLVSEVVAGDVRRGRDVLEVDCADH